MSGCVCVCYACLVCVELTDVRRRQEVFTSAAALELAAAHPNILFVCLVVCVCVCVLCLLGVCVELTDVRRRQEVFTSAAALELAAAHPNILFVSDVRTGDGKSSGVKCCVCVCVLMQTPEHIERDMAAQWEWHVALRAACSLLKFRLPWTPGTTTYLAGM